MIKLFLKLFSFGCLSCGYAITSKSKIFCPQCEYRLKKTYYKDSNRIISAVSYKSDPGKKLILYMKDHNDPYAFDYSAKLIFDKLREKKIAEHLSDYYITYAPRNPVKKLFKRFDQSKEIADFLSFYLFDGEDRVISLFKRYPFADEQKTLSRSGRKSNAKEIFSLRDNVVIPEKVIVVDDVTSTGSTLFALKDILFEAGVRECVLCTVAVNNSAPIYG